MKKVLIAILLTATAMSLSGCGCSRPFANWFNRGGSCAPDPCATGPRATVMYPSATIPPGVETVEYPRN